MLDSLQLWALGAAAILDTALLLALREQRNRPYARVPILTMLAGAWLWHCGSFLLSIVRSLPGPWAGSLQWTCLMAMAAGLLLMPSGMLHTAVRLWGSGLDLRDRADPRHAWLYLPLLALAPLAWWLEPSATGYFLTPLLPFALPYLVWTTLVNLLACIGFLRTRALLSAAGARRLFAWVVGVLLVRTALDLFICLYARAAWPAWEGYLLFACGFAPVVLALLFAYYVMRFNFLQLVLERTVVYAALVAGVVLFHQVAFQEISVALPDYYRLPLEILETTLITALAMLYQPLRQRLAEALRYLMGIRVAEIRERSRRLAMQLSAQAHRSPAELLDWFGRALREALDVEFVCGWIFAPDGGRPFGDKSRMSESQALELLGQMRSAGLILCSTRYVKCSESERPDSNSTGPGAIGHVGPPPALLESGASLAVVKSYQSVTGLLLVGRHRRNQEVGEEAANAVLFLVEQLAITLENNRLQVERLAAERRALQHEKLSAIGLLASSIAHEVKNPLSAIKTIATVLGEELGPDSPHAEDVSLILGEVDRLATTTAQLLEQARPRSKDAGSASIVKVLNGTLQLLRHVTRQQEVTIATHFEEDLAVRADEGTLREIFFNLLTNSLEAAGPAGHVSVACRRENGCLVTQVRDSGPGIADQVRQRLFEPFLTSKATGTGLGLYVVSRRVDELGGAITFESGPAGTSFFVRLPVP